MKNDKILIDREKLNLLLDSKKQYIGNKITIDSILSSVSFLVSVFFAIVICDGVKVVFMLSICMLNFLD